MLSLRKGSGIMFEIKKLKFKHILQIDHLMIDRQITCLIGAYVKIGLNQEKPYKTRV